MTIEDILNTHLSNEEKAQLLDKINTKEDFTNIRTLGLNLLKVYNQRTKAVALTESTAKNGNIAHNHRFKEVFTRMEIAQNSGFYMEASALMENLLTDRLISLMKKYLKLDVKNEKGYVLNFKGLLDLARNVYGRQHPVLKSVNAWRRKRNNIIHGFMEEENLVEDFFQEAKANCLSGRKTLDDFMTFFRVQKGIQKKYEKHKLSADSRQQIAILCSGLKSQKLNDQLKSEISDVILKEKRRLLRS